MIVFKSVQPGSHHDGRAAVPAFRGQARQVNVPGNGPLARNVGRARFGRSDRIVFDCGARRLSDLLLFDDNLGPAVVRRRIDSIGHAKFATVYGEQHV